jgi:hypothetical protein
MKRIISVLIALLLLFAFPLAVSASVGGDDDGGLLGGLVSGFLNGLKDLFIPDADFFDAFNADIQNAIDRKTGGLASYFQSVTDQFSGLQTGHLTNDKLDFEMPDNILYPGYKGTKVNLLGGLGGFVTWFRPIFSAFMVVSTIVLCYRKTISLFKGGEA